MMDKDSLRPIEAEIAFNYKPWVEKGITKGSYRGYFHGFSSEGSNDDGIICVAIVELENGQIIKLDSEKIKFLDREVDINVK